MKWKRGPIVGRGSYAIVSIATTSTGDTFAVKTTKLSESASLQKEQHFLSQLTSSYIIQCMGSDVSYDDNKPMYNLFMEYATGGTISDMIRKQGGSLDEPLIRSYTYQILLGLDHLHVHNLVHCDIKCSNLLICKDGVKVGDLGCAKMVENDGINTSQFVGTPVFMAPEVARGEEQGFPADVWAVGCAIIEMATGSHPWPGVDDPVICLYRIGYSGEVPEFPKCLSEEGQDFLDKCLKLDAKERSTIKELLQHPFVCNLNSSYDQGFSDALPVFEVLESTPTTVMDNFSSESPVERIRQLVKASVSCLPDWDDEDQWTAV